MEYFVIAEREIILGFKLVGITGAVAVNRDEALDAFHKVTGISGIPVDERPKILILTEDVSAMIEDEVLSWQKTSQYPLIVEIPGLHGHLEGRKSLTDAIREAVGIAI